MGSGLTAPNTAEIYRFGVFTLDVNERCLVRDGQAVALAPRIFDTLLILVRSAGSLVRKQELMDFVWPGVRVEEVNLAHNISDLRRILGASVIQTVPKHGYRFVELVEKVGRREPEAPPLHRSLGGVAAAAAVLLLLASIAFALRKPASQSQTIRTRLASNPHALQLYLKGRYYFNRRTTRDFEKSAQMFREAVAADPRYAEAYAGLAEALAFSSKPIEQTQAALNRALELNPDLAEAHALAGLNAVNHEWNWAKAEREFRRAIALNPNLAEAHQWFGDFLGYMGRFDESAAELNAAIALDPLSPILWSDKCEMLTLASRYTEAITACRYVLDMYPDYFIAHFHLAHAYMLNGQPRQALEAAQAAVREDERAIAVARLAQAYAAADDGARARALLAKLAASGEDRTVPSEIAACYAILGERDRALDWLEKGRLTGAALMIELKKDPVFAPLRTEPRFLAILDHMNVRQ